MVHREHSMVRILKVVWCASIHAMLMIARAPTLIWDWALISIVM
ncbi:Uncharacterised protein [Segatella copri]|nr:Uncharacterised protein [Segatella copri]